MTVLVDTSVWSLALRRDRKDLTPQQAGVRRELANLIGEGGARIIGPVRQELLTGVRSGEQFEKLRRQLATFDDVPLTAEDYVEAARLSNQCRAARVAGSGVDFLLCAVAIAYGWPVFTADRDFAAFARHLPIQLHMPRTPGRA